MRIGFDTSPLARPHPPGLVRVVRETVAALERRARIDAALERRVRIEVVRLAPAEEEPIRRWRQVALPREARARALDGIHSFVSAFPLLGAGKRVHTVHELPWKHGVRENAGLAHRAWAGMLSRRADAVVTATEHTARELAHAKGRVHVVPWGVDAAFQPEPPPEVVDELVLSRYRFPEGPFALCLGAVRAKKNLAALLAGLAALRKRGGPAVQIVVTGPDTGDLRRDLALAQRLGVTRHVSTPGRVEDADLPSLLRLASLVPSLALSEGFGLPVLEAMACGTPVVVPRGSAQAEVAGELAIAVDPADAESVARGIEEALARREELRAPLAARARPFTWDRTAEGIERVWESLA